MLDRLVSIEEVVIDKRIWTEWHLGPLTLITVAQQCLCQSLIPASTSGWSYASHKDSQGLALTLALHFDKDRMLDFRADSIPRTSIAVA